MTSIWERFWTWRYWRAWNRKYKRRARLNKRRAAGRSDNG